MLGWPNEGKSYDRIKLSLLRIANVTYNYDNAWWDARQKTWTTRAFHIIDTVEINDSRASSGPDGLFPSRIIWDEVVFDSFQAGFLRNIDFRLCIRLEHPTALRMYRFLGKRFHVEPDWTFDLKEFAYEHIGLGRQLRGGHADRPQAAAGHRRAGGCGLPGAAPGRGAVPPVGPRLVDPAGPEGSRPASASPAPEPEPEPAPPLVAELIGRGVTAATAADLVRRHPAERIAEKIEVFDWLTEKRDRRIARSPAGYLVKSIADDFAPPKGFESRGRARAREAAQLARERRGRRCPPPRAGGASPRTGRARGHRRLLALPDPRAAGRAGRSVPGPHRPGRAGPGTRPVPPRRRAPPPRAAHPPIAPRPGTLVIRPGPGLGEPRHSRGQPFRGPYPTEPEHRSKTTGGTQDAYIIPTGATRPRLPKWGGRTDVAEVSAPRPRLARGPARPPPCPGGG